MSSESYLTASPSDHALQKVHFVSLGCPKNRIDTETMLAGLRGDYEIISDADEADVVVVNTCAFVESAKEESVNAILDAVELKEGKYDLTVIPLEAGQSPLDVVGVDS